MLLKPSQIESFTSVFEGFKARTGDENEPFRAAAASLERTTKEVLKEAATLDDAVVAALNALTPQFFYFDDYANLPGIVKIQDLLQADPGKLDDDKLTALSLSKLAGAEDEYLLNPDYETRKRELENVASALTQEVLKYWTTNPDLRVEIDISQRNEPAPNRPGGQQTVLEEIESGSTTTVISFHCRSTSARPVFAGSFHFGGILETSARWPARRAATRRTRLRLTPRAQKDLLNFIDGRLAKRCQVIYTTHSPFMIQPGKLEQVRVVEDRGREIGSTISANVLSTDADTRFPLQGALAYDLARHLFSGQNNLVIERTSDFIYLTVLSDWLREKGRKALDERWTLVPVGGVDMVPTFVALLGIPLEVTVLVDARKPEHQRLTRLAQRGYLANKRVVPIGEILQSSC